MDQEIYTLLQKGVIEEAYHSHGEFLSNVFLRPKKDGSFRMILNLKNLNSHVEYNKFKMDTLQSILKLVTPGCYMATIDLKDAYYLVPVAQEHRNVLLLFAGVNYTNTLVLLIGFHLPHVYLPSL